MYKDRTCRLAIPSVHRRPSLFLRSLFIFRPTANAVPDQRYALCAMRQVGGATR